MRSTTRLHSGSNGPPASHRRQLCLPPVAEESEADKRLDDFAANRTESGQPEVYARIQRRPPIFASIPFAIATDCHSIISNRHSEPCKVTDHLIAGNPRPAYNEGEYYRYKYQYRRLVPNCATQRFVASPRPVACNERPKACATRVFTLNTRNSRSDAGSHVND